MSLPGRFQSRKLRAVVGAAIGFVLTLGGCAIGTPFPNLYKTQNTGGQPNSVDENRLVVLALTKVEINKRERKEFDRQTRYVIDSMSTHPGMLGYSARRELLGSKAWTLSIWTDDAARLAFVRSRVHQTAIAKSTPAIVLVQSKRMQILVKDLPKSWEAAIAMLENPEGIRTYVH